MPAGDERVAQVGRPQERVAPGALATRRASAAGPLAHRAAVVAAQARARGAIHAPTVVAADSKPSTSSACRPARRSISAASPRSSRRQFDG